MGTKEFIFAIHVEVWAYHFFQTLNVLPRTNGVIGPSGSEGCVWFMPKIAPSKHWLAKILVEVLVAHDFANIGKKNELELARVHWHAKKLATIQTKTNLWVMTKILVRCPLATIQTHPTRMAIGKWLRVYVVQL